MKKHTKILFQTLRYAGLLAILPLVSFAQIQNPLANNITDLPTLISTVMGYIVQIGGIIAICAFIYAGFYFVKARGNTTELEKARDIFFNTIIGVAILLGAQLIASIVVGTIKNLQS